MLCLRLRVAIETSGSLFRELHGISPVVSVHELEDEAIGYRGELRVRRVAIRLALRADIPPSFLNLTGNSAVG